MAPSVCPVCGAARAAAPYPTPFPDPIVRCPACGTRFVHPAPSAAALRERYDAEHRAGKWRALFEQADPAEPARRARLLARLLARLGGSDAGARRLLDVGCGDGVFLDAARAAGWHGLGLELSPAALRARDTSTRHRVLAGTIDALRPGPRFAAITFWDVLEHLTDPAVAVRTAAALLEPGGVIAASMPNASGAEAVRDGGAWRYHDVGAYGHLVHLGPAQLTRLFTDAGLTPVLIETRGFVDLRDLLGKGARRTVLRPLTWLFDRASGVAARLAEPLRLGNTLLVVARKS